MKRIIGVLLALLLATMSFSGCSQDADSKSGTIIPSVKAQAIVIDGNFSDWDKTESVIQLPTIDAGMGEQINIPLQDKWQLRSFKLAWDGDNLYFHYDVMDKFLLWIPNNWWEGDGFEFFLSGNTEYRKDMAEIMKDEMATGQDQCLQYYMAGPEVEGFYEGRTSEEAYLQRDKINTIVTEREDGYAGEGVIPLSIIPGLHKKIADGKPISFSVRFRTADTDGITLSISNVALPVERNKLRPEAMQKITFQKIKGYTVPEINTANGEGSGDNKPVRVTNFRTIAWNGSVSISWNNPDADHKEIRVVRRTDTWPQNPEDGETVYKGNKNSFMDTKVKNDGTKYYYAAFAYNDKGDVSDAATNSAIPSATVQKPDKNYTIMHDFIGSHAFIDDPMDRIQVMGSNREYHPWVWNEGDMLMDYPGYPNNQVKFNPAWGGGGAWNFDEFYKTQFEMGIAVHPVIQGSAPWLNANYFKSSQNKPVKEGRDTTDPASYIEHAAFVYQLAARYGSQKVDDSLLKLASGQERLSGLGYIRYIENSNEPDKWWEGEMAQFSPEELAAMCSADYDGHMGTLGKSVGAKNADPNMKLVMGGLAGLRPSYVDKMIAWAKENRNGSFPADVINYHYYCTDDLKGLNPEDDQLQKKMEIINRHRELNLPDKELWLTEFGYDTYTGSKYMAPTQLAQAQWLLRSYLLVASAGVDKAFQFMMRDVSITSTTQYDTSGLTTSKDDGWQPKTSWYFVYTMREALQNMIFDAELETGNKKVKLMRFRELEAYRGAYAVWCPTADGTSEDSFEIKLLPGTKKARLIIPVDGSNKGQEIDLEVRGGKVKIKVEETPKFILFE